MKFTSARAYADPEKAARKLIEIANSVEAVQDGRILKPRQTSSQSHQAHQLRDARQ
jgi:hypothetical protein